LKPNNRSPWGAAKQGLEGLDKDFIESFIGHYEFNAEGRYAHDIISFVDKTARSLDELEDELAKQVWLAGRIVISGYEENAVLLLYRLQKTKIDDEASSKSNVGWSLRLHNRLDSWPVFCSKILIFFAALV